MKRFVFWTLLTTLILPQLAQGAFESYRGVRQWGMGGASLAVVNDETALLANPNGLAKIRGSIVNLIDAEITNSIEGGEILANTGGVGSANPQAVYDESNIAVDKPYYFKAQTLPSFITRNFGIGLLGKYEFLSQRHSDGTIDFKYQNDIALVSGFNLRFWGGRIKVGVNGKLINRVEYEGNRDPNLVTMELDDFATEGMGLGYDVGLTFTAPWMWLPAITSVIRDVGGTHFSYSEGIFGGAANGRPQAIGQSIDVGVAIFPIIGKHSRTTWTIEYQGIDRYSERSDRSSGFHGGFEFNVDDSYFFRGGYGGNAWTAGFEYASHYFQVQLATYSESVSWDSRGTQEDRRWIIKFVFRQ